MGDYRGGYKPSEIRRLPKALRDQLMRRGADVYADFLRYEQETADACEAHCPVCGYYCLGNGGHGCIDKPALCGETEGGELRRKVEEQDDGR
jgi:hypothetical protein